GPVLLLPGGGVDAHVLRARGGFTMVEVIVALAILSTAVLGLAVSASSLTTAAASSELMAQALFAAQDRIAQVEADGRYALLDSVYAGVEQDVLARPGSTRTTIVEHVTTPSPLDYKVIRVVVAGPGLTTPVERGVVVAAP